MSRDHYTVNVGGSITCKLCGSTSYNPNDVLHRFCGRCNVHLDGVLNVCHWCGEPVLPTDKVSRAVVNGGDYMHWECGLRSIVGGYYHQTGNCSCCGGDRDPDPPGMTRRKAALLAANTYVARHPPEG